MTDEQYKDMQAYLQLIRGFAQSEHENAPVIYNRLIKSLIAKLGKLIDDSA